MSVIVKCDCCGSLAESTSETYARSPEGWGSVSVRITGVKHNQYGRDNTVTTLLCDKCFSKYDLDHFNERATSDKDVKSKALEALNILSELVAENINQQ